MRLLLTFILLVGTLHSFTHANEFTAGIDAYEAGNFEQALAEFKEQLSAAPGKFTAAAHHNLALT